MNQLFPNFFPIRCPGAWCLCGRIHVWLQYMQRNSGQRQPSTWGRIKIAFWQFSSGLSPPQSSSFFHLPSCSEAAIMAGKTFMQSTLLRCPSNFLFSLIESHFNVIIFPNKKWNRTGIDGSTEVTWFQNIQGAINPGQKRWWKCEGLNGMQGEAEERPFPACA